MRNDHWHLLTRAQQNKINNLKANNWENIQAFILNEDKRDGYRRKNTYRTILVKWTQLGKPFQTIVSAQVGANSRALCKNCLDEIL